MAIIPGTAGNDFIHLATDGRVPPPGANEITGVTNAADSIDGAAGNDTVYAANGNDTLINSAGIDLLFGEGGNDRFEFGASTLGDSIDGGGGNDTLVVNNTAVGQAANFTGAGGISSIETIQFGPGVLSGATQQVVVHFTDAMTKLPAGLALNGSVNNDEFVLMAQGGGTFSMPSGYVLTNWTQPTLATGGDRLVLVAVDNSSYVLNGSALADSLLTAGTGDDTLNGNAGNDVLIGGAGADRYSGGDGDDILLIGPGGEDYSLESYAGGSGFDVLSFGGQGGIVEFNGTVESVESIGFNTTTSVTFRASAETVSHFGNAEGAVTLLSRANLRQTAEIFLDAPGSVNLSDWAFIGWNPADPAGDPRAGTLDFIVVEGSDGPDTIVGTTQRDKVFGNGGNDTIYGNTGADWMSGGDGNDTYYVDVSEDRAVETSAAGGIDTVVTAASFTLGANVENLTFNPDFNNTADLNGTGNGLANAITGNDGDNTLTGAGGNDTLTGGGGVDHFAGGGGNDTYVGVSLGAGETITEAANGGDADQVQSATTFSLASVANVERLTLTGTAAVNGTGNTLANIITGNDGRNVLSGGDGNDRLIGGGGRDVLVGGAGNDRLDGGAAADTFRFGLASGTDRILDFDAALDRFDLGGEVFTARSHSGTDTRLTYAGGMIVVEDVTGLTLAQWNALVLPAGGVASASALADGAMEARAWGTAFGARLLHEAMLAEQYDYL